MNSFFFDKFLKFYCVPDVPFMCRIITLVKRTDGSGWTSEANKNMK